MSATVSSFVSLCSDTVKLATTKRNAAYQRTTSCSHALSEQRHTSSGGGCLPGPSSFRLRPVRDGDRSWSGYSVLMHPGTECGGHGVVIVHRHFRTN